MRIVQPSYEIVKCPDDAVGCIIANLDPDVLEDVAPDLPISMNALQAIERAARTCYKTEDLIDEHSAAKLVQSLVKRGHFAMLEFGGDIWVKFISNRGFSHELVRHRLASYAQESTRYCNYARDKFDGEVSFIDCQTIVPVKMKPEAIETWLLGCDEVNRFVEQWYLKMIGDGVPAQLAREILTIGIKTEINIKANFVSWRHIFEQRTSRAAHPRMRELMIPLLRDAASRVPIVFDDLLEGVTP